VVLVGVVVVVVAGLVVLVGVVVVVVECLCLHAKNAAGMT
jgi:hypothetical protein